MLPKSRSVSEETSPLSIPYLIGFARWRSVRKICEHGDLETGEHRGMREGVGTGHRSVTNYRCESARLITEEMVKTMKPAPSSSP